MTFKREKPSHMKSKHEATKMLYVKFEDPFLPRRPDLGQLLPNLGVLPRSRLWIWPGFYPEYSWQWGCWRWAYLQCWLQRRRWLLRLEFVISAGSENKIKIARTEEDTVEVFCSLSFHPPDKRSKHQDYSFHSIFIFQRFINFRAQTLYYW